MEELEFVCDYLKMKYGEGNFSILILDTFHWIINIPNESITVNGYDGFLSVFKRTEFPYGEFDNGLQWKENT